MTELDITLLISRSLHIAAIVAAVGGACFLRFILAPALRASVEDESARKAVEEAVRVRWSRLVFTSIGILLLTGFVNFYLLAIRPKVPAIPYHAIFGVKLLAAMFIFFIASALAGRSPGFAKMRASKKKWLSILLVTAGLIIVTSGVLNQIRAGLALTAGEARPQSVAPQP